MKFTALSLAAIAAQRVAGHATFQALWERWLMDGETDTKHKTTCLRTPNSNSPVTDVTSNNLRCNVNTGPVAGRCPVAAGSTVTVEMHQQPGDRTCGSEAIGGAHYGPVIVYLSKVSDATTADGSAGWFKIFQDGWSKVAGSNSGDADNWGVKDLNKCCGRMNVKIPSDIVQGDYLLRAEVIALHAASPNGGAQLYMSCFQLSISGGGSANPATVLFPGAYKASDPGIGLSIHGALTNYVVPGPALYSGGSSKVAGASACVGVETGTAPGPGPTATSTTTLRTSTTTRNSSATSTTTRNSSASSATSRTTTAAATTTAGSGGCSVARYGQCGGQGYSGCTLCAAGSTCSAVSPPYYSQCL